MNNSKKIISPPLVRFINNKKVITRHVNITNSTNLTKDEIENKWLDDMSRKLAKKTS